MGEQGVANLSDLADENGIEWISPEEFERVKKSFKAKSASSVEEMGSLETDIINQNNDRQNAVEGKIESNDQATLSCNEEASKGITSGNESGTGSNQQEASQPELANPDYGESNSFCTKDAAEEASRIIRKELNNLNAGFNPKLALAGMTLTGYHIESGDKSFSDYVKAMEADLGPGIIPYLKSFYSAVIYQPGFDTTRMNNLSDVE